MATRQSPKSTAAVQKKGFNATPEQLALAKTVTYLRDKKELGLADSDMRTILKGIRMPRANLSFSSRGPGLTNIADSDPTDPVITLGDPVRPGQDGDPPFARTDVDPTDPARR